MAKIPSPYSISGPESMRPQAPAPVADTSGLTAGVQNLIGSGQRIIAKEQEKQSLIDVAAAEAYSTKTFLEIENEFQQDGDYATMGDRAAAKTQEATNAAAELIRNPQTRQRWLAQSEPERLRRADSIGDIGRNKANEAERVNFLGSLESYGTVLSEPTIDPAIRDKARRDLDATITEAQTSGLLDASQAAQARDTYIKKSEQQLSINTADMLIRSGRQDEVLSGTGIVSTGDPLTDARTQVSLPIVTGEGVNVADVNPVVLTRFEQVQSTFGKQVPIISGVRSPDHNDEVGGASNSRHEQENGGDAIDLDVSNLSKEERVKLIETASAMGFNGIGVYNNSIHLDTGAKRVWGPSHHGDSVPAWAKDALDRHTSGAITEVPVGVAANVDPRFASLDYQQRSALFDQAKQARVREDMEMQTGLELTAENAPAAIARTGTYENGLPTANEYVRAYGAQEGMQKWEAFDASVKVAQDSFSMRTMSDEQINALVEQATPTDNGDGAALQEKVFQQTAAAAKATLDARAEDPNLYVQEVFPAVGQAWERATADDATPVAFSQALTVTALAQEQLGVSQPQLLPKAMATNGAKMFNDATLTDEERLGALTGLVMATNKPEQQAQIFEQMVAAGVPETTRKAMDALARGDRGAAQRLFAASMVKDMPNKVGDITDAQINQEIQSAVFDTGQIGDVAYDLTYGAGQNFNDAITDTSLMTNSVKMRLMDGTAGGNLQRAIDMTVKDVFGDVQVVTGSSSGGKAGMKLLLPKDAEVATYQAGFDALLGEVGEKLAIDLERDAGDAPTEGSQAAIADAAISNYVEQTLSSGYFTGAGDGLFKFMDPNAGAPVENQAGEPLTFTLDEVLAAGATSATLAAPRRNPAQAAGAAAGAGVIRPPEVQ